MKQNEIVVRGARLHNLKNISVSIPKEQLVVLTGLSGSGKSTLGFDILNNEGQRQYMESLGFVSYGVSKPPVDAISGLSPTVSIDQHLTNTSPRSTVGTATDVLTYLRIIFARLGSRPCPHCGQVLGPTFEEGELSWDVEGVSAEEDASFPCPNCGGDLILLTMGHFSFNKPEGACQTCTGLGFVQEANLKQIADFSKSVADGAILGWDKMYTQYNLRTLQAAATHYGIAFDPDLPIGRFDSVQQDLLFYGVEDVRFQRHFPDVEPPKLVRDGRFEGVATAVLRRYAERADDASYREKMATQLISQTCPDCEGTRLRQESRDVTVFGESIMDLVNLPLTDLSQWLTNLPASLPTRGLPVAEPLLADLHARVDRLILVGAGYLTTARRTATLSGGEAQRLRLASLLGSDLSGLLYVFDEPTIGIHQRDTQRMIEVLRQLRDLGNTVLVIEHDLELIASADTVIDFGPGAGQNGGEVVAIGTSAELIALSQSHPGQSLTADYLTGRLSVPMPSQRRMSRAALTIRGARQNNLKNVDVELPLGVISAVTGVSGSGKSSLVFEVVGEGLAHCLSEGSTDGLDDVVAVDAIDGWQQIDGIVTIDQQHLHRMPRSNAATYTDTFTPIRKLFAATDLACKRGLTARYFSFNVPGGRCERCKGTGTLSIGMYFMPDVEVGCPVCSGRRFTAETLAITYRDHSIADVLDMTVAEALQLFSGIESIETKLQLLADVGLGYLKLGQPATTLSGGEAQRIKLAKELARRSRGHTLYLFDEPTTGLHLHDTVRLLHVLQRLVDAGNTVVVVEHNLELVKAVDWVIDLGPEGGDAGGNILAEGPPEAVALNEQSVTGQFLRSLLALA